MKTTPKMLWLTAALLLTVSCSPISRQVQQQSLEVPFEQLMAEPQRFEGEMVLLGGYIIETRVLPQESRIVVLQVPLSLGDRPDSKDKSRGRFIVVHEGYLDPEVYEKDRALTVAGTVLGTVTEKVDACPYTCLTVKSRELYLWPERSYYQAPYYDPFYGPYYDPFWDYPYWRGPYYPFGPRRYYRHPYPYWW